MTDVSDAPIELDGFTPFDPAFAENPYPAFSALRERSPVHHVEGLGWLVSRYDDVVAICRDPGLWSSKSVQVKSRPATSCVPMV